MTKIGKDAFKDCKKLTIRGYKNSTAHKYAKNNKINFKQLFSGKAQITAKTNSVKEGKTLKLKTTASTEIKSVKWTTSDKKIATIKTSGKGKVNCTVTGKKKGKKVTITADITFKNGTVKMIKRTVTVK